MGEISKKVPESRLKWYGHVCIVYLRREDDYVGKRVMEVPRKRRRGRPKRRWWDSDQERLVGERYVLVATFAYFRSKVIRDGRAQVFC